jgi:hypothetical protein
LIRATSPARLLLAGLAAAALAPPALAQQKGDQWEITVRMEMPGMAMPPQTVRVCTEKHARDEAYVPQGKGDCRMVDSKRTGNTLRYRMECGGKDAMVSEGEMTFAGDSYSGRMRMKGKSDGEGFEMSQTYSARKLGECSNPVR